MDHIEFKSGFTVTPEELNSAQTFISESVKTQYSDLCTYGVLLKESSSQIVNTESTYSIGVYGLVAYDIYGNRIVIPANDRSKVALTALKPDFTQNALLTQTGENFPINSSYYLIVRYAEVDDYTDPSYNIIDGARAYKHKKASFQLFLRLLDDQDSTAGNIIHVTEGDVILAKLTVNGKGYITSDETVKQIAHVDSSTVAGLITNENASNYGDLQTFDTHINAIGSGIVTASNIHGLSAADLGIDIGATGNHQRLLHTNGVRTDKVTTTTSAFYPYYLDESAKDALTIYIAPLSSALNECCVINGNTFTANDFASTYTCVFTSKAVETYIGYYLFYVSANSNEVATITYAGPFTSESDPSFVALFNDNTKFPICSFKWDEIEYALDSGVTSNYGIVPGTFRDRRSFFNMSTSIIKPDEIFALTQFAPICSDQVYLHNARIIGTNAYGSYDVHGKSLEFIIDGNTEQPVYVSFLGTTPDSILTSLIEAFTVTDEEGVSTLKAYPYFTTSGVLAISAATSIRLVGETSTAANAFGLTTDIIYAFDNIQLMVYVGGKNGYIDFIYENPANLGDQGNLIEVDYYLGGGKYRYNKFVYDANTGLVSRVDEGMSTYME